MIKNELEEIRTSQEEDLIEEFLENENVTLQPLSEEEISSINVLPPTARIVERPKNNVPIASMLQMSSLNDNNNNPSSSLQSLNSWKGAYNFDVHFENNKVVKGAKYIYSSANKKLYVDREFPCPISFFVAKEVPIGTFLRIQVFFSEPHLHQDVVQRCINHSMEAVSKGIDPMLSRYVVKCANPQAQYITSKTGRHSIFLPFQKAADDQYLVTHIFKFMCYSSCSGGMNRHAVTLVFTLENGNDVLGKCCIALKICACPIRDYKSDLRASQEDVPSGKRKLKTSSTKLNIENLDSYLAGMFNFVDDLNLPNKKKIKTVGGPSLMVPVDSYKDYKVVKKFYEMYKFHKSLKDPNIRRLFKSFKTPKNDDSTTESTE